MNAAPMGASTATRNRERKPPILESSSSVVARSTTWVCVRTSRVRSGELRELAVVPEKLRFFDLETGAAIG